MKTHTTEQVNELLDGFVAHHRNQEHNVPTSMSHFKKENGLLPTLEVNKWYRHETGCLVNYQGGIYGYGFNHNMNWRDGSALTGVAGAYFFNETNYGKNDWQEATHEEVETALIAEAKKRGFKEGVVANNVNLHKEPHNRNYCFESGYHFSYNKKENALEWFLSTNEGYWKLFKDGKWATIIEDTQLNKLEKKYKELGEEIENLKDQ